MTKNINTLLHIVALCAIIPLLSQCKEDAINPTINIDITHLNLGDDQGNSVIITFDCNVDWTTTTQNEWLSITNRGKSGKNIEIELIASPASHYREGSFTINYGYKEYLVHVIQEQDYFRDYKFKDPNNIDKKSLLFESIGNNAVLASGQTTSKISWIAVFDEKTKAELYSWSGENTLTLKDNYSIDKVYNFEWGYVLEVINSSYHEIIFLEKTNEDIFSAYLSQESNMAISPLGDNILIETYKNHSTGTITESVIISRPEHKVITSVSYKEFDGNFIYSGFKEDDKIWAALINPQKKIIEEWNGNEKYERNLSIYLGYGEYRYYFIKLLFENSSTVIQKTPWGYVIAPAFKKDGTLFQSDYLFLNNGKAKTLHNNSGQTSVYWCNWYEGSILFCDYTHNDAGSDYFTNTLIYSPEAELTAEYYNPTATPYIPIPSEHTSITPLSYNEFICDNQPGYHGYKYFEIGRYKLGETFSSIIWEKAIKIAPFESRCSYQAANKSGNMWLYVVDVLHFDGTKEQIKLNVNIETGDIITE